MLLKQVQVFVVVATAVVVTACSSLSTTTAPLEPGQYVDGLVYYLPKGRIHISGGPPKAATSKTNATGSMAAAAIDDPTPSSSSYVVTITADLQPDPSCAFYLKRNSNYLYDDDVALTTNTKGLLATGSAISTDETGAIISALAKDISFMALTGPVKNLEDPKPFDVIFDPSCPTELQAAIATIKAANLALVGDIVKTTPPLFSTPAEGHNPSPDPHSGIAFRLTTPFTVTVENKGHPNASVMVHAVGTVLLPDPDKVYYIDVTRMPLVKETTKVGFTDGVLTNYAKTVPSPILGLVGIPGDILSAIFPVLGAGKTATSGTVSATASK